MNSNTALNSPYELEDSLIEDGLARGQTIRFRVSSGSMFPTYYLHDVVLVTGREPVIGETALFKAQNRWVIHRVLQRDPQGMLLRGDADLKGPGHHVHYDQVFGTVTGTAPTHQSRRERQRHRNLLRRLQYRILSIASRLIRSHPSANKE